MDAPAKWNLPLERIQIMASTYVRLGVLILVCSTADCVVAQIAVPGNSSYGAQGSDARSAQRRYGVVPDLNILTSQATYPQTASSPSPYYSTAIGEYPTTQTSASDAGTVLPSATRVSGNATRLPHPATETIIQNLQPSSAPAETPYIPASRINPFVPSSVAYTTPEQPQYAATVGGPAAAAPMPPAGGSILNQSQPSYPQPGPTQPSYGQPIPTQQYFDASHVENDFVVDTNLYSCDPQPSKFFVTYDYLLWTISPPKTSTIGSSQLEGDYTRGGVTTNYQNSLSTSFLDFEFHSGHRVEFGCRDCDSGWLIGFASGEQTQGLSTEAAIFLPAEPGFPDLSQSFLAGYTDGNGDGFDDDLNLNNFFGRFGEDVGTPDGMGGFALPLDGTPDLPAPADTGDLQIYLPVFSEASVRNSVKLANLEAMYFTKMHGDAHSEFEFLYGVRFLDLEDYFAFSGTGGSLDAMSMSVTSENQLLGFQVGAKWRKSFGSWYLNAEGRFLAATNMQDNKMFGTIATNIATNSNGQNGPINLTPQSFNYVASNNEFSPLGELRLQAVLPINHCVAFRLGYTGFVAGGISRASQRVDYVLPRFGLNSTASDETVVFSSFNLGFEINR